MSALPRFSNLSSDLGSTPSTWDGLHKAAQELRQVREVAFDALKDNKQGFVSLHVRPMVFELQKELERAATKQFGLLGRLALVKESQAVAGSELLPFPQLVLAFAVHSAILNAGFVCTGSGESDFEEQEAWPSVLPQGWVDDTGNKFSFRYRPRSGAADSLIWKGVVMGDLLALSANDPYSSGKDAMTMHLRIKDFVKSKGGEVPLLFESKERELASVVEDRVVPVAGSKPMVNRSGGAAAGGSKAPARGDDMPFGFGGGGAMAIPAPANVNNQPRVSGGFAGDLQPGVGGSMLFGPGNPQFDARARGPGGAGFGVDPRTGTVPGARFDPYGPAPFFTNGANPDFDDFPPPGPPGPGGRRNFGGGGGGRSSNMDIM